VLWSLLLPELLLELAFLRFAPCFNAVTERTKLSNLEIKYFVDQGFLQQQQYKRKAKNVLPLVFSTFGHAPQLFLCPTSIHQSGQD
jgi:hypothetical protein